MACACKNKVNRKYANNTIFEEDYNSTSILSKIIARVTNIILLALVFTSMFIILIPATLWAFYCVIVGREVSYHIPNYKKWFKHDK